MVVWSELPLLLAEADVDEPFFAVFEQAVSKSMQQTDKDMVFKMNFVIIITAYIIYIIFQIVNELKNVSEK